MLPVTGPGPGLVDALQFPVEDVSLVLPSVVATSRERPVLFRALTGLRCTTFPEPEGIIPENGGIIRENFCFYAGAGRSYLATFCGRKGG